MSHGGRRVGAGAPGYSSEFLDWVVLAVTHTVQSHGYEWFKKRELSRKGTIRRNQHRERWETLAKEKQSTPRTEAMLAKLENLHERRNVAVESWRLGNGGRSFFEHIKAFENGVVARIIVDAQCIPKPTPAEMKAVYVAVAADARPIWGPGVTEAVVKRAWNKITRTQKDAASQYRLAQQGDPVII